MIDMDSESPTSVSGMPVGAWGTGVFANDLSHDVEDDYRDLVADGVDGPTATDRLVAAYAGSADDPEARADFWIGLAVTQHKLGRLEGGVRDRALQIIDSGEDLARWDGDARAARARVLGRVREQLTGPQPVPVAVRTRPRSVAPFRPRDVVLFETHDGRRVLLLVRSTPTDGGGDHTALVVLDWSDDEPVPAERDLRHLRPVPDPWHRKEGGLAAGFRLFTTGPGEEQRLPRLAHPVGRMPPRSRAMRARASFRQASWTQFSRLFTAGRLRDHTVDGPPGG